VDLFVQTRLGDDDAKKYAYGDEWYSFDEGALLDLPASDLIALETAMDYTLGELLAGLGRRSTQALRAALWISRKRAHPDVEKFKDFNPQVWHMQSRVVDGDGNVVELDEDGAPVPAAEGDADPLEGGSQVSSPSPTTP
jgi:hypothetical protein